MGVKICKTRVYSKPGHAVVTGAAADTNIAIAGIKMTDELLSVIEHDATSALPTDRLSTTTITSDGNIQCTVDTATDTLVVQWESGGD